MKFISILAATASILPSALAFCCSGPKCADGTGGTPCCATQSCNIFCCACGGHCRTSSSRRDVPNVFERDSSGEMDAFSMADTDGSGNVTLSQYLDFMQVTGESALYVDWFNKHDKNADGVITPDEISIGA